MARDRLLKGLLRERLLVTLRTGETFDGLLDDWDERNLLLVDAYAVTKTDRVSVDGGLWLQRDNMSYAQRLSP